MKIIAADIGGTQSRFALVEQGQSGNPQFLFERHYNSRSSDCLETLLERFIQESATDTSRLQGLSLALAGPVQEQSARLTNLGWRIEARALERRFGFSRVSLVNDFEAAALGILMIPETELLVLNRGARENDGSRAIIGAGTGLGTAYLHYQKGGYVAHASEAGHTSFAALDEEQVRLQIFLARRYGHVSYERILSGQGLVDLYRFYRQGADEPDSISPQWVNEQASSGGNPQAHAALTLLIRIYGSYAGDVALWYRPEGGIYLVGGVTAKIRHWIEEEEAFMEAYLDKGRMRQLVTGIPLYLVQNERVGLLGAVAYSLKGIAENPRSSNVIR